MDINLSIIFQYVVPAIIAGLFMALIGVIPYFISKRESPKERSESGKTTVETARMLYEGLATRVSQLEAENDNLRKQHDILRKENTYTSDLQATKYELEAYEGLATRVSQLEAENDNLRKQHEILHKENTYTSDLQATKYELEAQVSELTCRIDTLEITLKTVIDSVRVYIINPENNADLDKLLVDIEGKLNL